MRVFIYIFLFTAASVFAQWNVSSDVPRDTPIPGIYYDGTTAIACADSFIYISKNHGASWERSAKIGSADYIYTAAVYNNRIFVGTEVNGIYESNDGGKTWVPRNDGIFGLGSDTIKKLELRGDYLYAGTVGAGIFVLDLKGSNVWSHYSNGLYSLYSYSVFSLNNINGRLFTGAGISANYYVNEPNSSSWSEYKLDNFNSMVFYDFAGDGNNIYSAGSLGLFTSNDGGNKFSLTQHNIGGILNAGIALHGGDVYLSFTKQLNTFWFKSVDGGKTLSMIDNQQYAFVLSTAVIGNKLYAGRADGLWYRDLTTTSVEDPEIPNAFKLEQNYPNPFNPSTTIKFVIPMDVETGHPAMAGQVALSQRHVSLNVYDMLGREVATLVNENKSPGTYEIKFDASGLASGIYIYKLQTGEFVQTKKMTLLR